MEERFLVNRIRTSAPQCAHFVFHLPARRLGQLFVIFSGINGEDGFSTGEPPSLLRKIQRRSARIHMSIRAAPSWMQRPW